MLPLPPIPSYPPISPSLIPPDDDFAFTLQEQVISTDPLSAGGGGEAFIPPMTLLKMSDTEVKVKFAQVNAITPTDINTNIDVSGEDGTWSVYLYCELDAAGAVISAAVLADTSGVPANSTYAAYALIGEVDVVSGLIDGEPRPSLLFSQSFVTCGRDAGDPDTTPGTYHFSVGQTTGSPGDDEEPPPEDPPPEDPPPEEP